MQWAQIVLQQASLAWVKVVSQYKFFIVTGGWRVGLAWGESVSQYTKCIVEEAACKTGGGVSRYKQLYRDKELGLATGGLCHDTTTVS